MWGQTLDPAIIGFKNNNLIKSINQKYNINIMGLSLSTNTLNIIGIVYSGIAVALAVFQAFVKGTHSRALDYIQWAYFLAITSLAVQFSDYLNVGSSLITLNANTLTNFYCKLGLYVCQRPFALSFIVFLVGVILIFRLVAIPEKVREKGLTFQRIYNMLKGLIKWVYLPLVILSISFLINSNTQIIPAVVVLAVLIIFPIVQLILYRFFSEQGVDPLLKWLQFANYVKALLFSLLVTLAVKFSITAYYYYLALIIVAYAAMFLYIQKFYYQRLGRVLYILGQIIFYFLYSLYVSGSTWLNTYSLDLFGLGIILLIDLVVVIAQAKQVYSQWKTNKKNEVLPQESVKQQRKKNRYDIDEAMDPNASKQQLNDGFQNSGNLKKSKNGRIKPVK